MFYKDKKTGSQNHIDEYVLQLSSSVGKMFALRTFVPKSSYGFISPLELVHKVLTPKMKKKKMGVTDFVSEKMAVEKCLNFDKSVIMTRCSLFS